MRFAGVILNRSGSIILLVIGWILISRKLYKQLPFFSAYLGFALVAALLRLLAERDVSWYFRLYWTTEAGYGVLALLALNEVCQRLYELEYEDHPWFKFLIPVTAAVVLGISVWGVIYHPLLHGRVLFVVRYVFWFDLGVHCLEAGILVLLLVLALFFALPRSRYELGILGGFAVSACVTLATDLLRSQLGPHYEIWFQYGPPLGYLAASMIWLYGFWRPPAPPARLDIKKMVPIGGFPDDRDRGSMRRMIGVLR